MARLELRKVSRTFPGGIVAVRDVDLTVEAGELFVILGPSGSGKSTLLRLVAGLESIDSGEIWLDGRRIDGLSPTRRDVAMVFQDQVLYPHLNVYENVAFGLRARGVSKPELDQRVRGTSQVLGLTEHLDRLPGTLSGGQRRRVALARALVLRPKIFLLDEPFSGLDAPLRASTRAELVALKRQLDATIILVTHDQAEAMALGDRVAVVEDGQVVQVSRTLDLYHRPNTRFVARFIGQPAMNFLPCLVAKEGENLMVRVVNCDEIAAWMIPLTEAWVSPLSDRGLARVDLGFRPEQTEVRPLSGPSVGFGGQAILQRLEPMGHETLGYLNFGPHEVVARLPARTDFRVGQAVGMTFDLSHACWFDPSTGTRLV